MRITDDLHTLATAATRAVDLFERWLQLREIERGVSASVIEPTEMSGPTYYDTELNLRLNAAIERYVTEHGEWPTEQMRADFINNNVDFSQL